MSYDLQKLRGNEILTFKRMLDKYREYDKLDLLVHKTLKCTGTSKNDFNNRKVKQDNKREVVVIQTEATQLNKFCDGDSCEIPVFINEKC